MPPELFQPPKLNKKSAYTTGSLFEVGKALRKKFRGVIGKKRSDHSLDHSRTNIDDEPKFSDHHPITENNSDQVSDRFNFESDQHENTIGYAENRYDGDHGDRVMSDHFKYDQNPAETTLLENNSITSSPEITPLKSNDGAYENGESDLSDAAKKIQFTPEDKQKLLNAFFELDDKATPTGAVRIGLGDGRKGGPTVEAAKIFFIEVGCWPLNKNDNGDRKTTNPT
jgi:hypothetical protein